MRGVTKYRVNGNIILIKYYQQNIINNKGQVVKYYQFPSSSSIKQFTNLLSKLPQVSCIYYLLTIGSPEKLQSDYFEFYFDWIFWYYLPRKQNMVFNYIQKTHKQSSKKQNQPVSPQPLPTIAKTNTLIPTYFILERSDNYSGSYKIKKFCRMKDKPNIRARMALFDSVKENCWCYRWFHLHSFILIIKSIFKPLIMEDLLNCFEAYWPQVNYSMYGKTKSIFPHYSAMRVIQKMIRTNMIIASILAIIDSGLGFAGPIIIKYILIYVNTPVQTDRQRRVAFALAGIWIGLYFIKIFVKEYWQRLCAGTGVCVEATLQAELYRKIMRVSSIYNKYITLGDYYGYLFVDVGVITTAISQFANLFGAPTTLILSVIFVCVEVGPYGLLLLLVICLAILINLYIDFMRSSVYAQKLIKFENRLAQNIHLYNSFKTLRCLVWEKMILQQNVRLRVPQNKLNRTYYILGQFYIFITRFAPYLIIFLLFLIGFLNDSHDQWNSTIVFTVIGYISVIMGPLSTLPNIIVALFQASKALDRFDNFLQADELLRIKDIYMDEGSVEINNLVLSTGTRKSIDRLLIRQSLYIGEYTNLLNHVQSLPIEVRTHQSLDDITQEDIQRFRKCLMCLNIPFKLNYGKGQRVVLLSSKSGAGKTSFMRAFLGLLNVQGGYLKYSGKLGFASADSDFYLHKSVRQNVLFGEPYDKNKLQRAYHLSGLYKELGKLTNYDKTIVDFSSRLFAPAQKCLISLARAIYYNCDILLLDQFFQQFDIDESIDVYNRMCINLKDKLIFITSNTIHYLKPQDRVIILQDCTAVQEGSLAELKARQNSKIRDYYVKSPLLLQNMASIHSRSSVNSAINNAIVQSVLPRKSSVTEHAFLNAPLLPNQPILSDGQILVNQYIFNTSADPNSELYETPIPRTPHPPHRYTLIQLRYYWAFLRTGGWIFIFVLIVVASACAAQTFASWIIGSAANKPFGYSYGTVIIIYAFLQIGYGILLLVSGIFMPIVAYYNTERLCNYFNEIVMRFRLTQMQKISKMFLTFIVGYDVYNYYTMCDQVVLILNNIVSLISTIVIMGLASYYIWIIAGAALIYCLVVFLIYRRTAREVFNVCGPIRQHFFRTFEDGVIGSQVFQYYDKVQWFRLKVFDAIYMFSVIWKNNTRFILHGFSILIGMAELILIAGIVFLAVGRKQYFSQKQTIYVGVAVSAAPTLMGIVTNLLNTLSDWAGMLNYLLKVPAETLRYNDEIVYSNPPPPANWPWNGKIQLRNMSVEKPQLKKPLLNSLNLVIPSGQIVGVYGDYDSDITTLFLVINKLKHPIRNDLNSPCGQVLISDVNIAQIGQLYATEHVVLLDAQAPAFSGTLRYNVDPFNMSTNEEIENAIKMVNFWEDMENDYKNPRLMQGYGTLDFIIEERGNQIKSSSLQKINLIRAILKKPKILLMEYGLVKVNTAQNELYYYLMNTILRECTIIILTSYLHNLFHCDRVIGIEAGKIIEDGPPNVIASNPNSRLYRMLLLLSYSPSYEPEALNLTKSTSYGPY